MVIVRPFGFCRVIAGQLTRSSRPLLQASSSLHRKHRQVISTRLYSTNGPSHVGASHETQNRDPDVGRGSHTLTCFSLISDFVQPLVNPSRPDMLLAS